MSSTAPLAETRYILVALSRGAVLYITNARSRRPRLKIGDERFRPIPLDFVVTLERGGWIERERSGSGRELTSWCLTEKGRDEVRSRTLL